MHWIGFVCSTIYSNSISLLLLLSMNAIPIPIEMMMNTCNRFICNSSSVLSIRYDDVRDRYEQHDYDSTMLDRMSVTDDGDGSDVII